MIVMPSRSSSSSAAAALRYSSNNTPQTTEGTTPSSTARDAGQSMWCSLPGSATALLTSVTRLMRTATMVIGASPKPLVMPMTIIPSPNPVTVWK